MNCLPGARDQVPVLFRNTIERRGASVTVGEPQSLATCFPSSIVCVPGSAPLLAQQGEVHKQISGGWNTMARSNAKKVLTQPTESW